MNWLLNLLSVSAYLTGYVQKNYHYPEVKRDDEVAYDYFGTKINNPYHWLEDVASVATQNFVKEQNELTTNFLEKAASSSSKIKDTFSQIWSSHEKDMYTREPILRKNSYYIAKRAEDPIRRVYYKSTTLEGIYNEGEPSLFLDPHRLSLQLNRRVHLGNLYFSENDEMVAYTLREEDPKLTSNLECRTIRIRSTSTGEDYEEELDLVFDNSQSIAWIPDNLGFLYARFADSSCSNVTAIYYHKVGTSQLQDPLVFRLPPPYEIERYLELKISDDYDYVIVHLEQMHFAKVALAWRETKLTPLTSPAEDGWTVQKYQFFKTLHYKTNNGSNFYLSRSPHFADLISVDIYNTSSWNWDTNNLYWNEEKGKVGCWEILNRENMVVVYEKEGEHQVDIYQVEIGNKISLNGIASYNFGAGTIYCSDGHRNRKQFVFKLSSYATPGVTYLIDFRKDDGVPEDPRLINEVTIEGGIDPSEFVTKRVLYKGQDGTDMPMWILHKKGHVPGGSTPTLLNSFGAFGAISYPVFKPEFFTFVYTFDGVYAEAEIRRDGPWWFANGTRDKQTSFSDFIAAAEYLIRENYTNPSKLAIHGGYASGLVVATCVNQRPDLFGAAIPSDETGFDFLHSRKPGTHDEWCENVGCSEHKEYFHNLLKYSPLHNVRGNVTYPAVLVILESSDSYKYISELQHVVGGNQNQIQPLMMLTSERGMLPWWDIYSFLQLTLNYTMVEY